MSKVYISLFICCVTRAIHIEWITGIVKKLISGRDGVVRGARVLTKGQRQVISRPSRHLYPVKVRDMDEVGKNSDDEGVGRVKRRAAIDARWKTKAMLS